MTQWNNQGEFINVHQDGCERNLLWVSVPKLTGKHLSAIVFQKLTVGSCVVSYYLNVIQVVKINKCCKVTPKYFCITCTFYPTCKNTYWFWKKANHSGTSI